MELDEQPSDAELELDAGMLQMRKMLKTLLKEEASSAAKSTKKIVERAVAKHGDRVERWMQQTKEMIDENYNKCVQLIEATEERNRKERDRKLAEMEEQITGLRRLVEAGRAI